MPGYGSAFGRGLLVGAGAALLYGDGLSQGAVSERLGWSRQTVNKRASRVRRLALELGLE